MTRSARMQFAIALVLDLLGAAGALLAAGRTWQTVVLPRPRPLADAIAHASGRDLEAAVTALALVALAGVVATLATKGIARRIVGALLVLTGAALAWRAAARFGAVGAARARELVESGHGGIVVDPNAAPHVTIAAAWPGLTVACGVAIAVAGGLILARGHTWRALATRYEAPTAAARAEQKSGDLMLWNALDRGEDPTGEAGDPARARADAEDPAAEPDTHTEP